MKELGETEENTWCTHGAGKGRIYDVNTVLLVDFTVKLRTRHKIEITTNYCDSIILKSVAD